jgi:hypothetical protein
MVAMVDDAAVAVKDIPDPVEQGSGACGVLDIGSFLFCPCFIPCFCMGSWTQINERQEGVVLEFGKYSRTIKEPGIWWVNCLGNAVTLVSTAVNSVEIPVQKIVDSNGNPLTVGAVVIYHVDNSYRAAIAVADFHSFIIASGQAVLKQVVQQHPYEDPNGGESLRNERDKIGRQLVDALQVKASKAGLKVLSFEFNELSYAPEIAPQMLKKQQAMATVQARNLIVQGAVETSEHAMQLFASKGYEFSTPIREKMIKDLMTVMVSDRDPHTSINVGAHASVHRTNYTAAGFLQQYQYLAAAGQRH